MDPKYPSESILTDLVLPSETNPLNNLFGELLARMDRAASIAAEDIPEECCNSICKSRHLTEPFR
jgi:acyl-CoA hydrolase